MKINEKNLSIFATSQPVDLCGYLLKRGEVNRAFQKRYFVLKGNLLFYFEKKFDREPQGLILLEGCTIELSEESEAYCFEIAFNANRTYILCADTQELMETWMKALTCAGYEYKKLMVAELQRKLQEIESETTTAVMPKPQPPRRQNPFNRPAPPLPPPPSVATANGEDLPATTTVAQTAITTMPFRTDHFTVEQQDSLHTNVTGHPAYGTQQQIESSPQPPPRANKPGAKLQNQQPTAVLLRPTHPKALTFAQFHERHRADILLDVLEYRMKLQPLIEY